MEIEHSNHERIELIQSILETARKILEIGEKQKEQNDVHTANVEIQNLDVLQQDLPVVAGFSDVQIEPDGLLEIKDLARQEIITRRFKLFTRRSIHPKELTIRFHFKQTDRTTGEKIVYSVAFPEGLPSYVSMHTEIAPATFHILANPENQDKYFNFQQFKSGQPKLEDLQFFTELLRFINRAKD